MKCLSRSGTLKSANYVSVWNRRWLILHAPIARNVRRTHAGTAPQGRLFRTAKGKSDETVCFLARAGGVFSGLSAQMHYPVRGRWRRY